MVMTEAMDVLVGLRQGLQADGADLAVESVEGDVATVRLLFSDETCRECIVPTPIMQQLIEAAIRDADPGVQVRLIDPRDGDGGS